MKFQNKNENSQQEKYNVRFKLRKGMTKSKGFNFSLHT